MSVSSHNTEKSGECKQQETILLTTDEKALKSGDAPAMEDPQTIIHSAQQDIINRLEGLGKAVLDDWLKAHDAPAWVARLIENLAYLAVVENTGRERWNLANPVDYDYELAGSLSGLMEILFSEAQAG